MTRANSAQKLQPSARQLFDEMIAQYAVCERPDEQTRIRNQIWQQFGACGATFISDMANFSSTSRKLGVCHFLKLIHRARLTIAPIIAAHNGTLLKYDADNCYAFFASTDDAIQASLDINAELFLATRRSIFLIIYTHSGRIMRICCCGLEDFIASCKYRFKLGRSGGESTGDGTGVPSRICCRERRAYGRACFDIEISYLRLPMRKSSIKPNPDCGPGNMLDSRAKMRLMRSGRYWRSSQTCCPI
jgi:hypothetical protein